MTELGDLITNLSLHLYYDADKADVHRQIRVITEPIHDSLRMAFDEIVLSFISRGNR
jgi:hypothetical protein